MRHTMQAIQISQYSHDYQVELREIPIPTIASHEVLIQVKAAAINPLDLLNIDGSIKLVQSYKFPFTLGNECAGIITQVGSNVTNFKVGDQVYTRLPLAKIGAFAEYVAVDAQALAHMPQGYDFITACTLPLAGLTIYQALTEELQAQRGQKLLITGASGSLGQVAVPLAREMGLEVYVTGNAQTREQLLQLGASKFIDYRKANYWEELHDLDYVIDTTGMANFKQALSVLKRGGKLLALKGIPNKEFARKHQFPWWKRWLFNLAGGKYDRAAQAQGKEYRFMFVRADGAQLQTITHMVEKLQLRPPVHPQIFTLATVPQALQLVAQGKARGKVVISLEADK